MTHTLKFAGLVLLTLVTVSACHKKPKDEAAPGAPPVVAAPMSFAKSDADVDVRLSLPDPIKLYPELHARLYQEGVATLTAFIDQARKDHAQNSSDGFIEPPYSHAIDWKISAQSERLVSLFAEEDDFQGGAHPNHTFQTLLWDKTGKDLLSASHLFAPGADFKPINSYVCRQIEAARSKRAGEPITQGGSGFACPKFAESRLILLPSVQTGKIGAIGALYAPYDVGPYAEGAYEIHVPQAMLTGLIAPEFASQFGGEAVKAEALAKPVSKP
ncbi:hypothetical protein MMA231_02580 [Asticcacaulis sp. MM231]|uniref:DUF3298 and DUF4163 domain-containing protein n=1 Tax=Asticcacaulis sp. MM231 TaxID=3157666 RepID=UPI0032D569DC